jgi:membrane protein
VNLALFKDIWTAFNEDKVLRLASSIAFCAMFSIAPLLIVLIAILGWFVGLQNGGHGHHVAENALIDQVSRGAGKSTADSIRQLVTASFNKPRQGFVAQIIGWVAFLLGAAALFSALQDALNAIWHVESTKGGWKQMVRDRLASFGMILAIGFLLVLTFLANAAIAFVGAHFLSQIPLAANPVVLTVVDQIVSFLLVTLAFALIYKVLPDVTLGWRDVWVGAAVTALLFVIGEALIALYLALAGVASAYGAAGSLLAGLLWIYYSAIILLLGAEFTKVVAGQVKTVAPSSVRSLSDQPAGIDPRAVNTPTAQGS